jgi:hypothetical protein
MLMRYFVLIGLLAAPTMFSGCGRTLPGHQETMLDKNWGRSYESAKYNQILNHDAGKSQKPVAGLDGQAADSIMEKYRESPNHGQTSKKVDSVITIENK